MILALGLLLGALTVAWVGVPVLARSARPERHPALPLASWVGGILAVLAAVATAAALLLLPDPSAPAAAVDAANTCVRSALNGLEFPWVLGTRLALGVVLAGFILRVGIAAIAQVREERAERERRCDALDLLGRPHAGVWWIPGERPDAYSLGGPRPRLVATSGLTGLGVEGAAAVLAHERAHLRGHHHLVLRLARVARRAAPWVPLFAQAPAALGLLVEMAADADASRVCGHRAVAGALRQMAASTSASIERPSASLAAAADVGPVARARLVWLDQQHGARRWARSRPARVVAACTVVAPVVAAVLGLCLTAALWCELVGA